MRKYSVPLSENCVSLLQALETDDELDYANRNYPIENQII